MGSLSSSSRITTTVKLCHMDYNIILNHQRKASKICWTLLAK